MPLHRFGWLQKTVRHSIDLQHEQDILLRRAADLAGQSTAQFIIDSVCKAAERTVLDQRHFVVSGSERQKIIALRQRVATPSPALCRLLTQKAPWEGESALHAPEPLAPAHSIVQFDCGRPALNDWLAHRARQAQLKNAARTFVVSAQGRVVGYFSLSVGQIDSREFPGYGTPAVDRQIFPLPIALLNRLAVDSLYQHQGLGRALLRDAILHVLSISEQIGVTALLIQPLNEPAARFYLACGFIQSPAAYKQLMLPFEDMQAAWRDAQTPALTQRQA
ncbi:MAG: GNAT family N-acetyltransferase [Paludibacterium sp.]|uniref:GNAT family N-acetyltransferase n=1 Tax=Paludibacterium sp. TaxID=1917523 RepID=UPI0025CEC943|nr:GNAT family N-acetyltransferase [Paludibacterium sp.]MBV8046557.1 GNAT family N-acetyltransferase [Paludibacterium sp.]MBV8648252.1 GNAT family N-acetyltransferase [Paludibacterium sp.]